MHAQDLIIKYGTKVRDWDRKVPLKVAAMVFNPEYNKESNMAAENPPNVCFIWSHHPK